MPEKRGKDVQAQQKRETVVYMGPEIPGTVSTGAVFCNGLPERLGEAVGEMPPLKMLLVPVGKIANAKKELKMEGSAIRVCYEKAAMYAARKGGK